MDFLKRFAENLHSTSFPKATNKNFERQRIYPKNVETFCQNKKTKMSKKNRKCKQKQKSNKKAKMSITNQEMKKSS
jgi:hypothetical protein